MLRQYFNCNERLEIFLTCFCNILFYVGRNTLYFGDSSVLEGKNYMNARRRRRMVGAAIANDVSSHSHINRNQRRSIYTTPVTILNTIEYKTLFVLYLSVSIQFFSFIFKYLCECLSFVNKPSETGSH